MEQEQQHYHDDAFCVEKTRWGTYRSKDKEGNSLVTSLNEESCIFATRHWLKWKQDSICDKIHE